MFDVTIKINGKKRSKKDASLKDYINVTEYNEKYKGMSFITNKETVIDAIEIIKDWFGDVSTEDIESLPLAEIMKLYRQIESNVTEVFTGVPLQEAIQTLRRAQKEIQSMDSEEQLSD